MSSTERSRAEPTDRELGRWGTVMLVGFGLIGWLLLWRGLVTYRTAKVILGAAFAVQVIGLFAPPIARPLYRAWMAFAHVVGRVNTTILLTLLYLLVFTPLALVFRLTGRDALRLGIERGRASYWEEKARPAGAASYFNQF